MTNREDIQYLKKVMEWKEHMDRNPEIRAKIKKMMEEAENNIIFPTREKDIIPNRTMTNS